MKKYKISQPINWYKATWDALPNPIVFAATQGFKKEKSSLGISRAMSLWIFKKTILYLAYDQDDLHRMGEKIVKSWRAKPYSFQKFKRRSQLTYSQLEKMGKSIERRNLKNLTEKQLLQFYDRLLQKFNLFWSSGWAVFESLALYLQSVIKEELNKDKPEIITKLTFPTKPSFLQELNIKKIKIAKQVLTKKKIKKLFKEVDKISALSGELQDKDPILYKKFISLQKTYYWISNNYVESCVLKVDFFIKEVKKLLQEVKWQKKNLEKIENELILPITPKKKLIKSLKLSKETKFFLNLLDWATHSHNLRKRLVMKIIYPFDLIFKEISKRNNLNFFDLKYLTPEEIKLVSSSQKTKNLSEKIKQRKQGVVFWWERKQKLFLSSNPKIVQKYFGWLIQVPLASKLLQGTAASLGRKLKGTVKVCLSINDIKKVKKNDILVAPNTTPDYLSAMKKASAILTEKGGLTTHAAIVSRELKIPCIVGIPNVAEILKDGDLVEVDANKGIVRILKLCKK